MRIQWESWVSCDTSMASDESGVGLGPRELPRQVTVLLP